MSIIQTVKNTISEHDLISRGDRILVGLSGGSDSVTLLYILCEIADLFNLSVSAAHINHCLRPTANRDMEFCKRLCDELHIELHCLTADIKAGAKKASESEELYARSVRYDFFNTIPCDKIATAHNKNDNAETILFNFMRGAASNGLSGIPYKRGKIIRPLLDVKKDEILSYCEKKCHAYMTDETNFTDIYTRNKIRLSLLPEIERNFNAGFVNTVTANAVLMREDTEYLNKCADDIYKGKIFIQDFKKLDPAPARRVLQLHYKKYAHSENNLPIRYIDEMIKLINNCITGQKIDLPGGFEAILKYDELIISKKRNKIDFSYKIHTNELLKIPEIGKAVLIIPSKGGGIFLDNTENLIVRNRKNGDIFFPTGMNGRKKLSDYFTDKKIPLSKRDEIPLLMQNEQIISVIGFRNDRRFSEKGKIEYKITIKELSDAE